MTEDSNGSADASADVGSESSTYRQAIGEVVDSIPEYDHPCNAAHRLGRRVNVTVGVGVTVVPTLVLSNNSITLILHFIFLAFSTYNTTPNILHSFH
jgi:hypothetical protein